MLSKFPLVIQPNQLDCAPACIKMMLKHFNIPNGISFEALRILCLTNENGTEINNFTNAINEIGLNAKKDFVKFEALSQLKTPIILFVDGNHYLILYKTKNDRFYIADPAKGRVILTSSELKKRWLLKENYGAVILVGRSEKSNSFDQGNNSKSHFELSFKSLYLKILSFKKGVRLILLLVFLASAIQLIIPFLTQSVVDTGINNNDVNFIYIILIAQFALFVG
ncbi:MAG: hypothetical protein IT222_04150, partial [Crocinitomix sp.]|nr:hypothetical protein [Crocinitomix sp.]